MPDADSGDEVVAKKAPTKEWTDQEIEVLHDFVESLHLPAHEKLTLAHWKRAERRFEGRTHDSIRRKWETMRKQDVGGESDDDDKAVDAEAEEE